MNIRAWQEAEKKEFGKVLSTNPEKTWVSVDACVGSGKTFIPFYQIKDFINQHKNEKTFHFFVTPRIKLNRQQLDEFKAFCKREKLDVGFKRWDCKAEGTEAIHDKDILFSDNAHKHYLVFIVDKSLWGTEEIIGKNNEKTKVSRLPKVMAALKDAERRKFIGGVIAFDECHNYQSHAWNTESFLKDTSNDLKKIAKHFSVITLMSGTPADYQNELLDTFGMKPNELFAESSKKETMSFVHAKCPLYTAVKEKYVVEPVLYRVFAQHDQVPAVLKRIYENEKQLCDKENENIKQFTEKRFTPRIVANMCSIDECQTASKLLDEWFEGHIIVIHSEKKKEEGDDIVVLESSVDGLQGKELAQFLEKNKCEDAVELLEKIDENELWENEPVILFQVDMISEGVNLKSFTAALVQTKESRKQMQQIGRPIRNLILEKNEECVPTIDKIHNGHASIYVIEESQDEVINLLCNLTVYGLTDECFKWYPRPLVAVQSSTLLTEDEEGIAHATDEFDWAEEDQTPELARILFNWNEDRKAREVINFNIDKIESNTWEAIQSLLTISKKKEVEEKDTSDKKTTKKSSKKDFREEFENIKNMDNSVEKHKALEEWFRDNISVLLDMRRDIMKDLSREGELDKDFYNEYRDDYLNMHFDGEGNLVEFWTNLTQNIPAIKEVVFMKDCEKEFKPRIAIR